MAWVRKAKKWLSEFREKYGYKARRAYASDEITSNDSWLEIDVIAGSIILKAQEEEEDDKSTTTPIIDYQNIEKELGKEMLLGIPRTEKIYRFYVAEKPLKVKTDMGIRDCNIGDFILVTPSKRLFVVDKALGFYIFEFQG